MKKILLTIVCIANYFFANAQMFHENFEQPDSVIATTNDPGSNWGLNSRVQTSGAFSDSASLTQCDTIILTTIPFSTVGYSTIFLKFKHICKIHFFDEAFIEVSTDGGTTWSQVCSGYLGFAPFGLQQCSFSSASYGAWFPGLPDTVPNNAWWKLEAFDLSTILYNVPNAQIRFVLIDVNCDVTTAKGGWFIDDIQVTNYYFTYYSITGKLFADFNSNQIQDTGEPAITNYPVSETTGNNVAFSQLDGTYSMNISDTGNGNFTIFPQAMSYYNIVPGTINAFISSGSPIDSLNDFAFQPAVAFNDLCVTITPISVFRAGFGASYCITYENAGTTTINNCSVIFFPDSQVSYVASNVTEFSITADSVIWNIGTLAPFQTGSIVVTVIVNVGTPIGTLINSNVRIEPVAGDVYPGCNYAYWEVLTIGSFDPNDIIVDEDTLFTTQFPNPPYLEYIIRFQNTGNDTCFNTKILNPIDTFGLQLNTLEFVASSHPVNMKWINWKQNMEFTFDNILLPDSNVNEPMSHGFVRYRIKPKTTLVAGDLINNIAAIYFDFNQPVITNTAVTEIVLPTGEEELKVQSLKLKVFPNPVREELIVSSNSLTGKKAEVKIFDLFGREVFQLQTSNLKPQTKINVSGFSHGVYIIELQSGEQVLRGKFLKE